MIKIIIINKKYTYNKSIIKQENKDEMGRSF
jgi:hypothetical protein